MGASQSQVPLVPGKRVTFDVPASGVRRAQELFLSAVGAVDGGLHAAAAGSQLHRSAQPRRADDVHRGSEVTGRVARAAALSGAPERTGGRELAAVIAVSAVLSIALTYPIAFKLGRSGRVDNGDGQLSIWNVAWVARTLVVDPRHVFDANIFYPHRGTLAHSRTISAPARWRFRLTG